MIRFPPARTADELSRIPRGDARVHAAAGALWRGLRLGAGDLVLFDSGSLPVFAAGREHVLKLFPACHRDAAERERSALDHLHEVLPVPPPAVVASGEIEGWRYLVMRRVQGRPLDSVWPSLTPTERVRLAGQAGRLLAALHGVDTGGVAVPRPDWSGFVREQTERCVQTQRRFGTPSPWLEQIPRFLETAGLAVKAPPVLLHTEVMPEHLFAELTPTGWSLTGLIDFEPAMVGAAEYEFAAVGLFLTRGDELALHALLRAYGWRDSELGLALQRRFLAYALLHRYSNLNRFLENRPPPQGTDTLDGLASWWWALPKAR